MLRDRQMRKLELDNFNKLPDFASDAENVCRGDWTVSPVPGRLRCRHVDLGDVSPSNLEHFVAALKSTAQGIQVHIYTTVLLCL